MTPDVIATACCPACAGTAEPEQDGDLTYYACPDCSHEFGWQYRTANDDDRCAVGISEPVRRRVSAFAERALADTLPPLLQIGRRPS